MSLADFFNETLQAAGHELKIRHGTKLKVGYKADASLVTEADLASEKVVIDRILKYFPEDKICSEEAGLSSADRTPGTHIWIIDPLDGTTNFANSYPFYCISIGRGRFRGDGIIEVVAAGILDPCRDRTYLGFRGEGAHVNGAKMHVAAPRELAKSFLVTGFYYMKGNALQAEIDRFARVADKCQSIRRDGAAALDLALVAEGIYDGFWEAGLQPWDVAAGSLLVTEAGGRVQNYQKNPEIPYDIEAVGVIAGSNSTVDSIALIL